jgi:hypothetical protein
MDADCTWIVKRESSLSARAAISMVPSGEAKTPAIDA